MLASRKGGVDAQTLQTVCTRTDLLNIASEPLTSEINAQGQLVETYAIPQEKGSILRALVHTSLDITTFFFWELIGTPLEASLSEPKYAQVEAIFDAEERLVSLHVR